MSVEQITALSEHILPFTKEDNKCLQKQLLKQRNRALLERILKTMVEKPYELYSFDKK